MNQAQTDSWKHLQKGLIHLFAWMKINSSFFRDNAEQLPTVQDWIKYLKAVNDKPTPHQQHVTLVQVLQNDRVVAVGFFQCSSRNVMMNWLAVKDGLGHSGIGTTLLKWYLDALPSTAAKGQVGVRTLKSNQAMRQWCERFKGKPEELGNDTRIPFKISDACARLGIQPPYRSDYHFSPSLGDYTFRLIYAGLLLEHADEARPPIMNSAVL